MLRGDPDSVVDRMIKLNHTKCKLMYYGNINLHVEYLVKEENGSIGLLEKSISERD